jgi:hypothetical protein
MMKFIPFAFYMLMILLKCRSKQEAPASGVQEGYIQVTGGKVWYDIVGTDKKRHTS